MSVLSSFPITLIVGSALGFLSGLGVGGGSLLILWLTLVLNQDPQTARMLNLLFFLPAGAVACGYRIKEGTLKVKSLLPAMISGAVASMISTWISVGINTELLRKGFGILLLATGLREIFYRPRNAR